MSISRGPYTPSIAYYNITQNYVNLYPRDNCCPMHRAVLIFATNENKTNIPCKSSLKIIPNDEKFTEMTDSI